jgi:hypothetical protein
MQARELGKYRPESTPAIRTGSKVQPKSGPYFANDTQDCKCSREVQERRVQPL